MSDLQTFQKIAEARRSVYALNDQLPVSKDDVVKLVEHAVLHTPSAFNSQSSRLVVLLGEDHKKLWQITEDELRKIVKDDEQFEATKQKLEGFKAGAGTVLFFEDKAVVENLQDQFALYADRFPVWAEHASAMHQYVIWSALASLGIGANLQHYNPIIDEPVAKAWNIDPKWKLIAQLVFGGVVEPAGEKQFAPLETRLKVYGK
ncbi:nitroreductase family protein [Psychrobacter lutiphocae]|uniref:nitroreductase family protein n=1 Tax=Psychrobacter lutiphocae TaxID=540500 RepID=UPI00035D95B0|nr:nitroreductase family protein [Psychrobacter lutiphocae]